MDEMPHTPTGEHAEVDMTAQNVTMDALLGADGGTRAAALAAVHADPAVYVPPVLAAVSVALVTDGAIADGASWFYAAQLRARFDANRCTDPTAAAACDALTEWCGPAVNEWAFTDTDRLRRLVAQVVAWDRATPHRYDPRWIALHGMSAFTGSAGPLCRPQAEWPAIAERTRAEYLAGLDDALAG